MCEYIEMTVYCEKLIPNWGIHSVRSVIYLKYKKYLIFIIHFFQICL